MLVQALRATEHWELAKGTDGHMCGRNSVAGLTQERSANTLLLSRNSKLATRATSKCRVQGTDCHHKVTANAKNFLFIVMVRGKVDVVVA